MITDTDIIFGKEKVPTQIIAQFSGRLATIENNGDYKSKYFLSYNHFLMPRFKIDPIVKYI